MCDLCGHNPCLPGCPNKTARAVCTCDVCKGDILPGERYLDEVATVCESCLEEMGALEILEFLGYGLETAEEKEEEGEDG